MPEINYCPECRGKINNKVKFCPSCGSKINKTNSEERKKINSKREKVLNQSKNQNKKGLLMAAVVILFISAIIFFINIQPSKEESIIKNQPKVSESVNYPAARLDHLYSLAFLKNGKITIPLDVVKENKFVKYDYVSNNKTMPLLAYITEEGKIVTAISMCEPCDSKDFHIIGSDLVCNSCGTTWNLNTLNPISGSCGKYPPDPLPSKVVGNEIQIDEYLVTSWTRRNI